MPSLYACAPARARQRSAPAHRGPREASSRDGGRAMNQSHLTYLASPEWAQNLRVNLLPWLRETVDLGDDVLEIGPGPGLTTDLLLQLTTRVTAIEIDP